MPIPPRTWTRRDVDEHWMIGHQVIGEEAQALKIERNPHLRLAACAQRLADHFGEITKYDLDVIFGSLDLSISEHGLIALTDGVWLPRVKSMPDDIKKKRIGGTTSHRLRIWWKLGTQLLRNPWNVVDPVDRPSVIEKVKQAKREGSLTLRFAIFKRDNYRCRLCGRTARDGENVRLEVDHITPRSKGGTNDPSNLWVLCFPCNRGKGTQNL